MNSDSKAKLVEDWYMPVLEGSVMRKINSIRDATQNPNFKIDEYQADLRNEAISLTKDPQVVVDIGAHIGIWSVAFAKIFKTVHAFEINPDTLPSLYLNLQSRQIKNVIVYPHGLGDQDTTVALTPTAKKSMATSVIPFVEGDIPVKRLDDLQLTRVDLIKIDVEGFEPFVILGGQETIKRCRPVMVLEDRSLHQKYGDQVPIPTQLLKDLGMKEVRRYRKDTIYSF